MNIFQFLDGLSIAEREAFAERAGTTFNNLKQLKGGFRLPSPKLAKRLVAASEGKLTLAELRPDIWGDDPTK